MEIYSGDSKVGYIFRDVSKSGNKTKIEEQTVIKLDLLGTETEMDIRSQYLLKSNRISSFVYTVSSSSITLNLKGEIEGNKLILFDLADSSPKEYTLKHNFIVPSVLPEYIHGKGLKEGSSFYLYLFDPVNIYTGYDPDLLKAEVKVNGTETVETKTGTYSASRVTVNFLGAENTLWITKEGINVLEKFEPSLTAVISSKDEALKKRNTAFDITEKTSIASSRYIHNPREVKKMVVLLGGVDNVDGLTLDDSNYQSLSNNVL